MPNLLVTLDYDEWTWADWMTPPYSEDAITASDVTDADTIAYITDEIPKLSIIYGGEKYDAEGTALYVMGTERTGTAYGDETFTDYPFYLVVPSLIGSNFDIHIPTENPGSVTVKLYDYYEEDPLACNWKENILLTPPEEEECIPCEEIADLDERATALDERVTALEESGSDYTTAQIYIGPEDWSNNTATKAVTGVTTTNTVIVSPAPNSAEAYATAGVLCTAQGGGTLTFTCDTVPNVDLYVNIVII